MPRQSKKTKIETVPSTKEGTGKKNLFPHSQFPIRVEFNEGKNDDKHILYFQNVDQMEKYKNQRLKNVRNLKIYQKDTNV